MNSCHFGNICSLLLFFFFPASILIPGHLLCMSQTHTHNFSLWRRETMPAEKMNKEYSVFMIPLPPAAKQPARWKLELALHSLYVIDTWISISGSDSVEGQRRAQFGTAVHLTVLPEEISTLCPSDAWAAQLVSTKQSTLPMYLPR